jgi:hypothetical protein
MPFESFPVISLHLPHLNRDRRRTKKKGRRVSMRKIHLVVQDVERIVVGAVKEPVARALLAALSAEPYRIDEWLKATRRFAHPVHVATVRKELADLGSTGSSENPLDDVSADAVIDLQHRILFVPWAQDQELIPVRYVAPEGPVKLELPYTMSHHWLVSQQFDDWLRLAEESTLRLPPWHRRDRRQILYGPPMLRFLLESIRDRSSVLLDVLKSVPESPEELRHHTALADQVRDIHANWLTHSVQAWDGRMVRDALLDDHDFLMHDLDDRGLQWSLQGNCPALVDESDEAYRWGGCGETEAKLYYALIRVLLYQRILRMRNEGATFVSLADEISRMADHRDRWMTTPQDQEVGSFSPDELIKNERRRQPQATDGVPDHEACDCPVCRVMPDASSGPMFWSIQLDFQDEHWPFGTELEPSDSEVDEEDREEENENDALRASLLEEFERVKASQLTIPENAIWKNVYLPDVPEPAPPELVIFTIAACTGELIEDLKQQEADRELIDQLLQLVEGFADAVRNDETAGLEAVIHRFCESLDDLEHRYGELEPKTKDLQTRLIRRLQAYQS